VGTPIAGRGQSELEDLIGLFVNTLVLRTDLGGDPTLREVLHRVETTALEAYTHQDLPFDKLVAELAPERNLGQNPLVQVVFALQNLGQPAADEVEKESGEWVPDEEEAGGGTAKVELTLTLFESEGGLSGQVEYATDLFEADTVARWMEYYERILRTMV